MRVLVAHGYTDLATPYLAARFLVGQLEPLAGARPIELQVYRGGHMMYLRPDSRAALWRDVRELYRADADAASQPSAAQPAP
jgi:carboxypeptidase C (cathepsin A)